MNLPEGVEIITVTSPEGFQQLHRVRITIGEKQFLSPVFTDPNRSKDAMMIREWHMMIQEWHRREVAPFLREQEVKTANECGPKPARKFDFTI